MHGEYTPINSFIEPEILDLIEKLNLKEKIEILPKNYHFKIGD